MKKNFSKVMLVAAAAMAFFACQKQEEFQPEFEEVNGLAFTSEKPSFDDETKTYWTGETIHWSKDDNIRVAYTCDGVWQDANGNPEQGKYGKLYASEALSETVDVATFVVPGTFKGSEQGDYKFYGIYPSTLTSSTDLSSAPSVSIDIQSVQTPAVNSFDAIADVMVAQSDIYKGIPRTNDEKNGSISLKWNRLVAHGHITLKSLPVDGQEVVKSIVLTADTDADMVTDLLNNKIGRRIGAMYPGSSRKELALRVLEEYWRNGLYSYEQGRDGRWYVQKKRIPDNVFYDLYNKYKKLNKFGR
jgi:hypothetical protein